MKTGSTQNVSSALTTVSAAFVTAAFTVIACGSFAALIFSGPLSPFVPQGIWIGLFTALGVGLIVALASSFAGAIAIPQDRVAPILALMAASIVSRMKEASPVEKCLSVLAAIALVSLITGAFLYLLGRLRLGNLIRYIPYPVIGGFLAGSGWLLVLGALRVMTGHSLNFHSFEMFCRPETIVQWFPGVAFGGLLCFVLKKYRHSLTVPVMLVTAVGLFYVVLLAVGWSANDARLHGWLPALPGSQTNGGWSPFSVVQLIPTRLLGMDWAILATILLTSVVSILLTASALELAADEEIDLNRELRAAGLATFVVGLGGGMVGFHSLSMSRLVLSMGARSRWVGVGSALICGAAMFFGAALVLLVPQFVCGGLLFFLGLTFLWEWIYEARRTLTTMDYTVVLLIVAVVGAVGYPQGVGVGIIAAIVIFIHNYSRVDVVTHAHSGAEQRSNVDRSMRELRQLREHGDQICILRLQGFIFFGTANHLLHEVRLRAGDAKQSPLRFVILDLQRVTGVDSSAIFSLNKVLHLGSKQGFSLLMADVSPQIIIQLGRGGLRHVNDESFQLMPDLDRALEWCEEKLLAGANGAVNGHSTDLAEQLKDSWPAAIEPQRLLPYLEKLEIPAATHLIRQSEKSESLYFIESGRVTAQLEFADGRTLRLRTMGPGTVVGEVGLFLGGVRAASVVSEQACTTYRLTAQALERMNRETPDLSLALHRYLICQLGERMASNSRRLIGTND